MHFGVFVPSVHEITRVDMLVLYNCKTTIAILNIGEELLLMIKLA